MIFPRLMIQKRFLYSDKIYNYSSISNKLSFGLTTISVEETLSYFCLLDIDLFFLVIGKCFVGCLVEGQYEGFRDVHTLLAVKIRLAAPVLSQIQLIPVRCYENTVKCKQILNHII